jgi:hypothetical protein
VDTPIAEADTRFRDLPDPPTETGLVGAHRAVVVGRPDGTDDLAGATDRHLPLCARLVDELTLTIRPQSFRRTMSCSISLSSDRSATIRFSRAFSSSSCFNRRISDGIRPAYFFFHAKLVA